jgi:hypothetical protein
MLKNWRQPTTYLSLVFYWALPVWLLLGPAKIALGKYSNRLIYALKMHRPCQQIWLMVQSNFVVARGGSRGFGMRVGYTVCLSL